MTAMRCCSGRYFIALSSSSVTSLRCIALAASGRPSAGSGIASTSSPRGWRRRSMATVGDDAVEPGRELRAAGLPAPPVGPDLEHRVLHDVFGIRPAADDAQRDTVGAIDVALDQRPECGLVIVRPDDPAIPRLRPEPVVGAGTS